ncbi:hypothetical protein [Halorarius halobius]|nr:hypothetical protein [Halorarius halobius]
MSARDALPTGLALGGRHLPRLHPRRLLGLLATLVALYYLVTRQER